MPILNKRSKAGSNIKYLEEASGVISVRLSPKEHGNDAAASLAAAERAVPVRAELLARLEETESRRIAAMQGALAYRGEKLRDLTRALPRADMLTAQASQRLDTASFKLPVALKARPASVLTWEWLRIRWSVITISTASSIFL